MAYGKGGQTEAGYGQLSGEDLEVWQRVEEAREGQRNYFEVITTAENLASERAARLNASRTWNYPVSLTFTLDER